MLFFYLFFSFLQEMLKKIFGIITNCLIIMNCINITFQRNVPTPKVTGLIGRPSSNKLVLIVLGGIVSGISSKLFSIYSMQSILCENVWILMEAKMKAPQVGV